MNKRVSYLVCGLLEVHHGGVVVLLDDVAALQVHLAQEGHGHRVARVRRLLKVVQGQTVVRVHASASL